MGHGLFVRPLVSISLAFFTGIALFHHLGHELLPIILLIPILIGLISFLLLRQGRRLWALIFVSFLLGGFLDLNTHRPSVLLDLADHNRPIRMEGIVLEETKRDESSQVFVIRAYRVELKEWIQVDEQVQVIVKSNPQPLRPGIRLLLFGRLSEIRGFRTPGASKALERYKIKGIYTRLNVADGRYLVPLDWEKGSLEKGLLAIRKDSLSFLMKNLPQGLNILGAAILLGEKAVIPHETKELFSRAGLSHVLVVSGLHIGLVMAVTFFGLRWVLRRLPLFPQQSKLFIAAICAGAMVVFYTYLTGFQISGTRAMIMSLIFIISIVTFRLTDPWTSLAFAGLLIAFMNPHNLFSLSYQLSFLSVAGILWTNKYFVVPLSRALHDLNRIPLVLTKLIIYVTSLLLFSVGTNLFLLPILIYNFNQFSVAGVLSNIFCVPILGILVVPFGMAGIILCHFSSTLAGILINICGFGLHLIDLFANKFGNLSYASFYWVTPYLFEIDIYYLILSFTFLWIRGRSLRTYGLIALAVFLIVHVILVNYAFITKEEGLEITFLDVGQGSASVIRLPNGGTLLVDAGGIPNVEYDIGKEVVSKFLWHKRIRKIDAAVLTHGDVDHSGGYDFVLKAFHIKEFWTGDDLPAPLKERISSEAITLIDLSNTDQLEMNGARFEFFHPKKDTIPFCKDENDRSLVFKISWGKSSILFTGDNGKEILNKISQLYRDKLASDVLLVPHHGSKNSLSMEFLKAVNPKLAVVSCGQRNPFRFPHKEVIKALETVGAKTVSTDRCGAIVVRLNPNAKGSLCYSYGSGIPKVKRAFEEDNAICKGRFNEG